MTQSDLTDDIATSEFSDGLSDEALDRQADGAKLCVGCSSLYLPSPSLDGV